jgi:hypothetical protein
LCWRSRASTDRPSGLLDAADGTRLFHRRFYPGHASAREPTIR